MTRTQTSHTQAVIAFATAVLVSVLVAGCASPTAKSGPNPSTTNSTDTADSPALTGTLSIAAAASLEPAFRELADRFTAENPGVRIENLTFDGSSTLATQIVAGAPFDVFASADENNMNKVVTEGLTAADPVKFATSSLEIAVAPGNPLGVESLADLTRPGAHGDLPIVVICAPEVPCGAAAHTLLDRDGVDLKPASEEQNVTAVLTKVSEGEADAGLVYRSDILRSAGAVEGIEIPGSSEAAGSYMIAALQGSSQSVAAQAFVEFVHSDESRALLDDLGFGSA